MGLDLKMLGNVGLIFPMIASHLIGIIWDNDHQPLGLGV